MQYSSNFPTLPAPPPSDDEVLASLPCIELTEADLFLADPDAETAPPAGGSVSYEEYAAYALRAVAVLR